MFTMFTEDSHGDSGMSVTARPNKDTRYCPLQKVALIHAQNFFPLVYVMHSLQLLCLESELWLFDLR